jgi:hypothetical protein
VFVPFLRADLTLQEAVKLTQAKVVALAKSIGEDQEPAYYDEVIGSACLSVACNAAGRHAAPPPDKEAIAIDYQAAGAVGTAAAWDLFLKKHGAESDNFYVGLAKENLQKVAALYPGERVKHEVRPTDCPGGLVASVGNAEVTAAAERCLKPKDTFRDYGRPRRNRRRIQGSGSVGQWITKGWWNVTAGRCETLISGALVSRFYYVHAINYDQGWVWAGNASMCASDKVFTINGIEECVARGYEQTRFFEVDTGEQKSWTVSAARTSRGSSEAALADTLDASGRAP